MKRLNVFVGVVALSCVALSLTSAWVFRVEYRSFLETRQGLDIAWSNSRARSSFLTVPIGQDSRRKLLLECGQILVSFGWPLRSEESQRRFFDICDTFVRRDLDENPTKSLSHFVNALLAFRHGDAAQSKVALLQSQKLAPHEGWLAAWRYRLSVELFYGGDESVLQDLKSDVHILAQDPRLAQVLALSYLSDEELQTSIAEIVEAGPAAGKRWFLQALSDLNED